MGLSRPDVKARGGPSDYTLAQVERADDVDLRAKTRRQLEVALATSVGWVDRVLDGTATPEDLDPAVRLAPGARPASAPSGRSGSSGMAVRGPFRDSTHQRVQDLGSTYLVGDEVHVPAAAFRTLRPSTSAVESANSEEFAQWGPIPLRNAVSNVGVTLGLLANVEYPDTDRVVEARGLLRKAMNLLLDELDHPSGDVAPAVQGLGA